MNKILSRESLANVQHIPIQYVPSFYFTSNVPKETIESYISVIMNNLGMQVYGYNKQFDEYFGERIQKGNKIKINISLSKTTTNNQTNVIISTMNASYLESEKITKQLIYMLKLFEETKSIYKTKYYRAF